MSRNKSRNVLGSVHQSGSLTACFTLNNLINFLFMLAFQMIVFVENENGF